VIRFEGPVEKT